MAKRNNRSLFVFRKKFFLCERGLVLKNLKKISFCGEEAQLGVAKAAGPRSPASLLHLAQVPTSRLGNIYASMDAALALLSCGHRASGDGTLKQDCSALKNRNLAREIFFTAG